ncbi:MAG TPA: peptidase S41, partial [Burkholderiales bacterium]
FTPNGRSIQVKGITPDIVVEEATVTEGEAAARLREADLERHLANPQGGTPEVKSPPPQPQSAVQPPPAAPKAEDKSADDGTPPDIVSKNDYQLNQALNLLKGLQIIGKR